MRCYYVTINLTIYFCAEYLRISRVGHVAFGALHQQTVSDSRTGLFTGRQRDLYNGNPW